jgi:vanillate O-demethylase ferredoxin subunit
MRRVHIARKSFEALDICSFELMDPQGRALPPFAAGAHIDVHPDGGPVRQYSLCNDSAETHRYQIAVLRDPASRGGSVAMHALETGQTLRISDPKNHFPLAPHARHSVLLAGGIGITPILCMAERLWLTGGSFELHYCTRSIARAAFVRRIRESTFAGRVHFYFDDEGQRLDARKVLGKPQPDVHVYVCGPAGFMDSILSAARDADWPEERLHREYFAAAPANRHDDGGFEVQIASTGVVIRVSAEESIVAALANMGVEVPVSCEQGVCGTCLTRVLEGTPDHRDLFLTSDERARGDQFTPCCSRAKSARLVLDL